MQMKKSPKGTKGGKHPNGTRFYGVDNYRPESPGSGRVIGDLYDEDGNYYRTAVVADCSDSGRAARYCNEKNNPNTGE